VQHAEEIDTLRRQMQAMHDRITALEKEVDQLRRK